MINLMHIAWGLEVGGKEHFLYQLTRGLDGARFQTTIIALRRRGPFFDRLRDEDFKVACLDKGAGYDPRVVTRLARAIRKERPNIVVAHDSTALLAISVARPFAGNTRLPVVVMLHGGGMGLPPFKQYVYDRLLRKARAVIGVAPHVCAAVRMVLPPTVPVVYIPYGIDLRRFESPPDPAGVVTGLGLPATSRLVVMTARLVPQKNHALLIRVAARVVSRMSDCHFLLAGEGPCRPHLERMVRERNLGHNVHLLGMRLDADRLVRAADVCVLTSFSEGLPLAVQEYMAAGRPVVAAATPGVDELVRDGVNGYLVAATDEATFAGRIIALLQDPECAVRMGAAGRAFVAETFGLARMIERHAALYREVAGREE